MGFRPNTVFGLMGFRPNTVFGLMGFGQTGFRPNEFRPIEVGSIIAASQCTPVVAAAAAAADIL
jgi:hypothetical protein